MKRKLFTLLGVGILGISALTGCGQKESLNLTVWASTEDQTWLQSRIDAWVKDHPTHKITKGVMAEGDTITNMQNDLSQSADVFHFAGDHLGKMVSNNLIYTLGNNLVSGLDIDESVMRYGKVGNKQYGIPFTPNTYFMYYDASVYTEEDVKSLSTMLAKDITTTGKYDASAYNIAIDIGNGWYTQSFFFSLGVELYGPEGNDVANPIAEAQMADATAAAKLMRDLASNNKVLNGAGTSLVGTTCAATLTGTWDAATLQEALGENYRAVPLPKLMKGSDEVPWKSVGDYKQIGVKRTTKYPQEACEFAAFLANEESQTSRYLQRSTAPTNQKSLQIDELKNNAAILAQNAQLENTFAQPVVYGDTGFWDACTALVNSLKTASTDVLVASALNAFITTITGTVKE